MNFIPCRLDQRGDGLDLRLGDEVVLTVPQARVARYKPHAGRAGLIFGLRPEHLTEAKPNGEQNVALIDVTIEVSEPMGMETLVYCTIAGTEVCGRVSPNAGAREGVPMKLAAHLDNMHLVDDAGWVL